MKTQLYTIFLPCYAPKKDELLGQLRSRLDDVEFIGLDELSGIMSTEGREQAYHSLGSGLCHLHQTVMNRYIGIRQAIESVTHSHEFSFGAQLPQVLMVNPVRTHLCGLMTSSTR